MQTYDAIIIGTGQAGPALAHRLAAAGHAVAVIERNFFGGTCVNTGCTPTKTLVASAYAAHMARRAADFGVKIPCEIAVDMKAVKARKDHVSGLSRDGVERVIEKPQGLYGLSGPCSICRSEFSCGRRRDPGGQADIHQCRRAGADAAHSGLDEVGYFTNSSILDVDFLPPHLIILGGSYIGLEFAQIYRRFGSEVSVIEMAPRLIPREDEDTSSAVADILQGEGIQIIRQQPGGGCGTTRQRRRGANRPRWSCLANRWIASAHGRRPPPEHRRSRPGNCRHRGRRARLHRGRRPAAHQRAGHLGAGRLQRPGRLHPHLLQRLRDRRRQPARQRPAPRSRSHSRLQPLHRSAAGPRRPDRGGGSRKRAGRR